MEKTFTVKASADELMLSVLLVTPEDGVEHKGIVQFVHGMCEHKERYLPFMRWLAAKGYVCIIHDNRGHGASIKGSDDLGYMYKGGWCALVVDIEVVNRWVRKHYPGLVLTLFGHSMGSMAVRSYVKRFSEHVDRLFVCGSPSYSSASLAGRWLARGIGAVYGTHYRPALLQDLSFDGFNLHFSDEGYPCAWVCSDPKVLEDYHNNPLCMFTFTANGFNNLFGLMRDCYSRWRWKVTNPDMPVHFISGAEDPCLITNHSFRHAVDAMRKVGYKNVDSNLFQGMRHEILNETNCSEVWNYILSKIEAQSFGTEEKSKLD